MGAPTSGAVLSEIMQLLQQLPEGHYGLLRHLIGFLQNVVRHPSNKMTVGNTAAVFAPNLLRPATATLDHLKDTAHIVNLIASLITNAHHVFGLPELASLMPAAEEAPQAQPQEYQRQSNASEPPQDSGSSDAAAAGEGDSARASVAAGEDDKPWYYLNSSHQQEGPVSFAVLQGMFRDMRLSSSTYVFTDGLSSWTVASDLDFHSGEPAS